MSAREQRRGDRSAGEFDYDRTVAFSDGVFAIAMTLLVLSIDAPEPRPIPRRPRICCWSSGGTSSPTRSRSA